MHPDDVARINEWVDRMFESDERSIEYRIRRDDGTYFWVNDQQQVVRDAKGEPVEIVGSWTDVTQRKEAEAERETARSRLTLLLGAAPSVIYSFAATGDFAPTFVSANISHMLGFSADQYLLTPDFWRTHVHPDDLPAVEAKQVELFENWEHLAEYRFRKKDGSYIWVSDEQHLIRDRQRQSGRGGRLMERHRRAQGGGAAKPSGQMPNSRRRLRRRSRPARPRACSSPI